MVEIGKPNYSTGEKKRVFFKIKEGSNHFRILPPIGECASNGTFAVFEKIHWGFRTSDNKFLNFRCVERKDPKTKMVTQRCAMCDAIAEKRNERDKFERQYKERGLSPDDIRAKLKPYNDWLQTFNLDKKWHVNALDKSGEIGVLSFAHQYYKELTLLINDLRTKKKIDPVGVDQGVVFDFYYRKGNQATRVQSVKVVEEQVALPDGQEASVVKRFPLSEAVIEKFKIQYKELSKLSRELTPEQIKRVVDGQYDPKLVDVLWSNGKVTESTNNDEDDEPSPDEETSASEKTRPNTLAPSNENKASVTTQVNRVTPAKSDDDDFFGQFSKSSTVSS